MSLPEFPTTFALLPLLRSSTHHLVPICQRSPPHLSFSSTAHSPTSLSVYSSPALPPASGPRTKILFFFKLADGEIISEFLQPANDETEFNVFETADDKVMSWVSELVDKPVSVRLVYDKQENSAAKPESLKTGQGGVFTTERTEFAVEQAIPELFKSA